MTISIAKFQASKNASKLLLKRLSLMGEENAFVIYPNELPSVLRPMKYRDQWEKCSYEGWFDVRMMDGSLVQFRRSEEGVSYSFLETPLVAMNFVDFAFSRIGDGWELIEEDLRNEYELYLSSDLSEKSVTPIRYDYEPSLYRPGIHPAGHFHFGIGNQIRLCANRIPNPMSFSLFIVRQFFPQHWERLHGETSLHHHFNEIRENLELVGQEYFGAQDFWELIMK